MSRNFKRYEELEFTDSFMFNKILTSNTELCKELLELILQRKIDHLVETDYEYVSDSVYESRGIRMDVYTESEAGEVFDVEMQSYAEENLPKRCRYYHSAMDMEQLLRGTDYSGLKKTYVIFICKDILKEDFDRPVYTFRQRSLEDETKILDDDSYTVLVNAQYKGRDVSEDMQEFLAYVRTGKFDGPADSLTSKLAAEVEDAVKKKKWSKDYMRMSVELNHQVYLARQEALKEGIAEGRAEGRALEQANTEKERKRAEAAEKELAMLKAELEKLRKEKNL